MSLRDRVRSILDRNKKTDQQLDAEHQDLVQQPHYILEILQQPILAIPPSKRSMDDRRELLIQKLKKRWL